MNLLLLLQITIESESPVIPLMNKKAVGYYRVTYDADTWTRIADILKSDHKLIHPNNRAQLLCDTAHMAAHGHIDQVRSIKLDFISI